MRNKYTLPMLMMLFSHDELLYLFLTYLSLNGTEGFQTEKEGGDLVNRDSSCIGDYRTKLELHGIYKRNLKYNKKTGKRTSYIVFNQKISNLIELIQEYYISIKLLLNREEDDRWDQDIYFLYQKRLNLLDNYLIDKNFIIEEEK